MCGITGFYSTTQYNKLNERLGEAVNSLSCRGPDNSGYFRSGKLAFGHTRLSIIDISDAGNQPITDASGRYTIAYNGEVYNYKEIKDQLLKKGYQFQSDTDTEVILYAYIEYGQEFLERLNGFFALAIYDSVEDKLFIARDRIGIKPLYYYHDVDSLVFGSEMKAIMAFPIKREVDQTSLWLYLQKNYIPGPQSIFKGVQKLKPGHFLTYSQGKLDIQPYYKIPYQPNHSYNGLPGGYEQAKEKLISLLESSVKQRLISDVPIGAFLSGGIDSSVIVALASRFVDKLNTFSIGFKDKGGQFYDETKFAALVAKKYDTNHTPFFLDEAELEEHLFTTLDYIDEPFADSSSLLVNILSKYTRQHVKVALSGDGGDELFGGYNKHMGELRMRNKGLSSTIITSLSPLWSALPKSRSSFMLNKFRQFNRFAEGAKLSPEERYWKWLGFATQSEIKALINPVLADSNQLKAEYAARKHDFISHFTEDGDLNEVLFADMNLILPYDMLMKVDLMSMANSLEVRVPFLDHHLVEYAFSLPVEYKIDKSTQKKVVRDAFRPLLPSEIYDRGKKGFDVPLMNWFRKGLKPLIMDDLLSDDFIYDQGIFDVGEIGKLKAKLFSQNPGDIQERMFGLIVLQSWWKKWLS